MRNMLCKALPAVVILIGMPMGIPMPSAQAAGKESHEGMARAVHALLYAKELKEHGVDHGYELLSL